MRSRALSVLARSAESIALGGVFVAALVGGVVLHAGVPASRRVVTRIANEALGSLFQGRIVVHDLDALSLGRTGHVHVRSAEILDPEGHRVVLAEGIDAQIDLVVLLRSLKEGRAPEVALGEPTIEKADVEVDLNAEGEVGIARAFLARPRTTPDEPPVPGAPLPEYVTLRIPRAHVRHATVHGNVVPPHLDADANDVFAAVTVIDNQLLVTVPQAHVTMRVPRAPGQLGDVRGIAKGELTLPVATHPGAPSGVAALVMHWTLEGDGAGIPLAARMTLDHGWLEAHADIPQAAPEVVRRAFPALPLTRPVELHARAEGMLPRLRVTAEGRAGDSAFTAHGAIAIRENQPFQLDADLVNVDGAMFTDGPASDVSGHVHAEGALADGAPSGTFTVTTKAATVLAESAPPVTAAGTFDTNHVTATFRTSEPGVDVDGTVFLDVAAQRLDFDVRARSKNLALLARAPGLVSGAATAHATGALDLARSAIDAHVTGDGVGITRAPASARTVHAEARVTGPLAAPVVDVTASGTDVRVDAMEYPTARGRARLLLGPAPRVVGAELHVEGSDHVAVIARAREIRFGANRVEAVGGRVEGLGAPLEIEARVANGAATLRAKASDLDVKRLAALTGIAQLRLLPEGSRATLDIDVTSAGGGADGHFDVAVSGAKDGSAAELHGTIAGRHVVARGRVALASVGWVEVQRTEVELGGAPSVEGLRRATGAADLRGEIDLAQGAALFGGESIEHIAGKAILSARVERGDPELLPTVYASARTIGLDVTLNDEGKSTHIGALDGSLHVQHDGATDQTEVSLLTWDETGIVATGDAKAAVPLAAWIGGRQTIDRDVLGSLALSAVVDVPARDVGRLPGIFARPGLRGRVSARAAIGGSLGHPDVTLAAHVASLGQQKRTGPSYEPIDGAIAAHWNGEHLVATITADEQEKQRPAKKRPRKAGHVRGLVVARLSASDLFAGRPLAWNASGEVDVADLELAPLPLPENLRGVLTGHAMLRDMTGNPLVKLEAHVDNLVVGGVTVRRGDVTGGMKDGVLEVTASVRQADGGNGHVDLATRALEWQGTDLAWNAARATRLDYGVDRMRLSILRPFVRRHIPEIDGRIDGSGRAILDEQRQVFEGGLALSEGRLYVNAIGEEITDVAATAHFEKNGVFRIQDATGRVGAGAVTASATGRMNGLRFVAADAVVVIPSKDGVPLSAEGATFAQATGEVRLSARIAPDTKALLVTVAVPRSKVTLPDRGTQNLQGLDPDDTIAIGIRQPDGLLAAAIERPGLARRTEASAAEPKNEVVARFTVALGQDVQLEGRGLRLSLAGRTVVELTEEVAVTGQISLRSGGTINVQGRKFIVDRGTVTFLDGANPADPLVVAAAYWDAPDHTRVWVEFNGPIKTGKLTLRSEPSYSKSEILSILLFGRADPNQATQGERPSDGQQAAALGTGLASSGLNKALGELDDDFELEQDRTSANRVRTKVGYRLRRNLKVQLGYASGFSQREPDTTYLFLEWQFIPKWSVIGTRGDRGTSILDVLFQHRY